MDSITTSELKRTGVISQAMKAGAELTVLFHDKPLAVLVPHTQRVAEQAELERLRALVVDLERQATTADHDGESVAA